MFSLHPWPHSVSPMLDADWLLLQDSWDSLSPAVGAPRSDGVRKEKEENLTHTNKDGDREREGKGRGREREKGGRERDQGEAIQV